MRRFASWKLAAPALFLVAWGGNHFTPMMPFYQDYTGLSPTQTNMLLGYYVIGLVPGLILTASLSDQYGRKPVMLSGLVASIAGNLLIILGADSLPLLYVGRGLAGLALGVGMSVGTSWMKELSAPPWDPAASPTAGAKRPSITMTAGFGLGAGVTGSLAQWGPAPTVVPYVLFTAMGVLGLVLVAMAPETVGSGQHQLAPQRPWYRHLATPAALKPSFTVKILPAAPWVFGAAGASYGMLPQIMAPHTGEYVTAFATMLAVVTLGVGVAFQPLAMRIDRATRGRALAIGMSVTVLGFLLAGLTTVAASPALAVVTAVVLGVGYGTVLVTGLERVQAIAPADQLAGLTGIFYAATYIGFFFPTIMSLLAPAVPYEYSFIGFAVLAVVCLVLIGGRGSQTLHQPHSR